ncbi:hypothetical protein TMEC50S_03614 [Thauera mechernichensis]
MRLIRRGRWLSLPVLAMSWALSSNWLLGRYLERWRAYRWFPVRSDQLEKAQARYHRYGRWSLLLSWVPVIGDPLTVLAGVMREPLWSFVLIVAVAKAGRYIFIAALTLGLR